MTITPELFVFWWSAVGLVVGSFLNVAIHRLPLEGETVSHPRRSRCPSCKNELTWKENVPVLSWLLQRGRCRNCGWRIPWRYPFVELLTGVLWGLSAWYLGVADWPLVVTWNVVFAGLIVATFVDFDHFEIPDEVSIGGMFLAPLASLLVPSLHAHTSVSLALSGAEGVDRVGALVGSLAGMAVGGGVLYGIGWIGTKIFQRDAMGFGDVKLLAAGGGFIGPGGALIALFLGTVVASVAGLGNMGRFLCLSLSRARERGGRKPFVQALRVARIAGRYLPFGPYLGIGIGIVLVAWNHVHELWKGLLY